MKISFVGIPGLAILEPRVFEDERGFFFESYNSKKLAELGIDTDFVQDNHSRSRKGVLRGLHYQVRQCQTKLVRVTRGEIFDVAVDLRKSSPTFGHWFGVRLSAENMLQFYIPGSFAHGYLVLSETAEVLYKASDFYAPPHERCIRWNDLDLAIEWPLDVEPVISAKDAQGVAFREAELPADAVIDCLLSRTKRSL
ncbi:MAG: dTDP-4-dehydrorhamnose 3,5-epimerase [Syntrophobacter sp.]